MASRAHNRTPPWTWIAPAAATVLLAGVMPGVVVIFSVFILTAATV